jgi:uncharacterized coiled-coil DUF342 family protein
LFDENIRLRKLIDNLEKEINKQYIDIRDKRSKLNALNKTVQQLTVQRDKIKESLNLRIKEIEKVKIVYENLLQKTEAYKLHAEGIIKQLEAEIKRLKAEYEVMMVSINNYNKYISTNNVVRERETLRLGVLINTVKRQREIYDQKYKEYEEIRKQLNLIISELSTILKDIAVIERDLGICLDMKEKYTKDIASFKKQMVKCIQNRDLVKNKLKTCETYLSEIVEKIKQINIDIPKTDDELKESERLRVKQKQTLTTIERDHKAWIPYPHYSCDKEKEEYNVSEYARLNDSDMCKSRVDAANKTYIDLLNKEYQRKIDMVRDCKMNMYNVTPIKSEYAGIDMKDDGEVPFEPMPEFKKKWQFFRTNTKAKSDGDKNDNANWYGHMYRSSTMIFAGTYSRGMGGINPHTPKTLGYDPVLPGSDMGVNDADSFDGGGDYFIIAAISPAFTVSSDQTIIFDADIDDGLVVFVFEDGKLSSAINEPGKKSAQAGKGQVKGSFYLKKGKTYTISYNFYQNKDGHYLRWYGSGMDPNSICYPRS